MDAPQIQFCKSADGTRLGFATMGRGAGLPLLYMQGIGASVENPYWLEFLAELAKRKRVITFDRRGSGTSARDVERLGTVLGPEVAEGVTEALVSGQDRDADLDDEERDGNGEDAVAERLNTLGAFIVLVVLATESHGGPFRPMLQQRNCLSTVRHHRRVTGPCGRPAVTFAA